MKKMVDALGAGHIDVLFNPALANECPESTVHTMSEHS